MSMISAIYDYKTQALSAGIKMSEFITNELINDHFVLPGWQHSHGCRPNKREKKHQQQQPEVFYRQGFSSGFTRARERPLFMQRNSIRG